MLTTQLSHIPLQLGRILKHPSAPSRRKTSRHLVNLYLQNSRRIRWSEPGVLQTLRCAHQQRRQQWTSAHARRKVKLLLPRRQTQQLRAPAFNQRTDLSNRHLVSLGNQQPSVEAGRRTQSRGRRSQFRKRSELRTLQLVAQKDYTFAIPIHPGLHELPNSRGRLAI